ncbi:MAG: hypothetical protein R6V04_08990, partial [bacterium]
MDLNFIKKLVKPASTKIILLVLDGLGGLPGESGNRICNPNFLLMDRSICAASGNKLADTNRNGS